MRLHYGNTLNGEIAQQTYALHTTSTRYGKLYKSRTLSVRPNAVEELPSTHQRGMHSKDALPATPHFKEAALRNWSPSPFRGPIGEQSG